MFLNHVLLYFGSADQEAGEDAITDDTTYSEIKIAQDPQQPVREATGSIVFVCQLLGDFIPLWGAMFVWINLEKSDVVIVHICPEDKVSNTVKTDPKCLVLSVRFLDKLSKRTHYVSMGAAQMPISSAVFYIL